MIYKLHLFCLIILFFGITNASPRIRYRRQLNLQQNQDLSLDARRGRTPSGSIPGTSYYGIGSDPNYGSFIQRPNRPNGNGFLPISYNPNNDQYKYLVRESHSHQQPQQYQQTNRYNYNNNNNNNYAWLNKNNNQNPYYNRYAPGAQGWYATGSNYWFNNAQYIMAHPYLLLMSIALLVFCN